MKTKKVYPLGVIECPFTFADIVDSDGRHVCCISSVEDEDNIEQGLKEGIYWDEDGLPDVIIKDKLITFAAMKKALRLLEKDPMNKYMYKLIRKSYFGLLDEKENVKEQKENTD